MKTTGKLIKLSDNHYIVADDSEIKEDDFRCQKSTFLDGTSKTIKDYHNAVWEIKQTTKKELPYVHRAQYGKNSMSGICGCYKILYSTQPDKGMENVTFISLSEVEEAIKDNLSENNEWDVYFDENGKMLIMNV
jgi:lysine/ornithine N-monooxygenase